MSFLVDAYLPSAIAGAISSPFGPLTAAEDGAVVAQIYASDARTVWLCHGCPKQDEWTHAIKGRIQAVMLGVEAAFDFLSGAKPRAPRWMQDAGPEWLHRVASDPGRLWKRYLVTNTLFVLGAARQLLTGRR